MDELIADPPTELKTVAVNGEDDITDYDQMSDEEKRAKSRVWSFLVYTDSAPENWVDKLRATGLQIAISPLHDKDITAKGLPKKAHWHGLAVWPSPTTFNNANNVIRAITNGPFVKRTCSLSGSYQYFCHRNNPEKYQYNPEDIQEYNDFTLTLPKKEIARMKSEICEMIITNNITEYFSLQLFVEACCSWEYVDVVQANAYYFNSILNSLRNNAGAVYEMFSKTKLPKK